MRRLRLLNMPFAALDSPPLGLVQLKSVIDAQFAGRIETEVLFLNMDFAHWLGGADAYVGATNLEGLNSGIGDWFFRQSAFPDAPDNTEDFFRRYQFGGPEGKRAVRRIVDEKRPLLDGFLDHLIDKYQLDQADMVGFTLFFSQSVASLAMAQRLKRRNPRIVTVLGGPNCDSVMGRELVRQVPQIDWAFSGPALISFPQFLDAWLDGREGETAIDGVLSRQNGHLWESGAIGAFGPDRPLDQVVELDYDPFLSTLEQHFPNGELKPILFFETSRGCWWGQKSHCTFCGLNGNTIGFREMSPDRAVPYIRSLFRWSDRVRRFDAVDNIMPKPYLAEVLPKLDPAEGTRLFYEVRADLSQDDMAKVAAANIRVVQPGIEALNTATLKLMGKGTTAFHNLAFLKSCIRHDVFPIWNLLVGFPGEGPDSYEKYVSDMESLIHLPPPGGVFPVRFDRFSPYFNNAERHGLQLKPFDYYAMAFPFPADAINNVAYYFLDHNGGAEYIEHVNAWLPSMREGFAHWHARWYDPNTQSQPKLFRLPDGAVHDSRGDIVRRHDLDAAEDAVLSQLDKAASRQALVAALPHLDEARMDTAIAGLLERRLLFAENKRLLSLVFADEPPDSTFERLPRRQAPKLMRRERVARSA